MQLLIVVAVFVSVDFAVRCPCACNGWLDMSVGSIFAGEHIGEAYGSAEYTEFAYIRAKTHR